MEFQELHAILQKYLQIGISKGHELLLSPNLMVNFIDDLARVGVKVQGYDSWRFIDKDKNPPWIVEITGGGFIVDLPESKYTAEYFAEIVKTHAANKLLREADLVSLLYDDERIDFIYEFFKSTSKK